jgi:hypothetical protein
MILRQAPRLCCAWPRTAKRWPPQRGTSGHVGRCRAVAALPSRLDSRTGSSFPNPKGAACFLASRESAPSITVFGTETSPCSITGSARCGWRRGEALPESRVESRQRAQMGSTRLVTTSWSARPNEAAEGTNGGVSAALPKSTIVRALGLIALIFAPVGAYILWMKMSAARSQAREQLCTSNRLALGQPRSELQAALAGCGASQLKLHEGADGWTLETPRNSVRGIGSYMSIGTETRSAASGSERRTARTSGPREHRRRIAANRPSPPKRVDA